MTAFSDIEFENRKRNTDPDVVFHVQGCTLIRCKELLQALTGFFEHDTPVHPGALLFESDTETVADRVQWLLDRLEGK